MMEMEGEIQLVGELFQSPDVNAAREFFRQKSRAMTDKRMSVPEAVAAFIHDGDYIATGGFGSVRFSSAVLHEIVRTRKRNLGFSGHSTTHDFQILAAGKVIDRCDIAYVVGLELRGLSPNGRRFMESGVVRTTEWSNAGLGWRYKAAAMGVPFIPVRSMLGTDTLKFSAAKVIEDPFTGIPIALLPALILDVGLIHVHRADACGNAQIDGISGFAAEMARASKRLIISTEEIVETEVIRRRPDRTIIPYYLVDAVIEAPFGSHPGEMCYRYARDEEQIRGWVQASQTPETAAEFLDKYIHGVTDHQAYLDLFGEARLEALKSGAPGREA